MKKIISILTALVMLASCISAFAAVNTTAVDNTYGTLYFNDHNSMADKAGAVDLPYYKTSSDAGRYNITNGAATMQMAEAETKSVLYYKWNEKAISNDYFAFGYDIKIDGVALSAGATVLSIIPSAFDFYEGGSTRSYFYDANSAGMIVKVGTAATEDTPATLVYGTATLEQGKFYTFKTYVDIVNHTYTSVVMDGNTVLGGIYNSSIDYRFKELGSVEFAMPKGVNKEAAITLDNCFAVKTGIELFVADTVNSNANGKLKFSAYIPAHVTDAAVLVNGENAGSIALTEGKTYYDVEVDLPEGTALGEIALAVTAKDGAKDVAVTKNITLVKEVAANKFQLLKPNSSGVNNGFQGSSTTTASEGNGEYWSLVKTNSRTDLDIVRNHLSTPATGVVDFSFDFKTSSSLNELAFRMTSDTSAGNGYTTTDGLYNFLIHGNMTDATFGSSRVKYKLGTDDTAWNNVRIRSDFPGGKYYAYINGELAESGNLTVADGVLPQIKNIRMYIKNSADNKIYIDNFKIDEISSTASAAPEAKALYGVQGVKYENAPLSSFGITGFEFKLPVDFDAATMTDANVAIKNAAGDLVDAEISYADKVITASYSGEILSTGNYKLVIGKNATIGGEALGANYEIPFELVADNQIISPQEGSAVNEKNVKLEAFVKDATKVEFYLNDEKVSGVTNGGSGDIYSATATVEENGLYYFDVYAYDANGLSVTSTSFNVAVNASDLTWTDYDRTVNNDAYIYYRSVDKLLFTGRVCFTGTVTFTEYKNSYIKFGTNTAGLVGTGDGWGRMTDSFGLGNNPTFLFNANGKIGSSNLTYDLNTPYDFKYVLDFDADQYEFYVNDVLVAYYKSVNTDTACELCDLQYSFRAVEHMGANNTAYTNLKVYTEAATPKVSAITADGVSAYSNGLYIVPETANEIVISLDSAYADLADKVAVLVDGEAAECDYIYNAEAKTLTLTGLSLEKGQKVEVVVSETAQVALKTISKGDGDAAVFGTKNINAGSKLQVTIFVANSNNVCILPLKLETENGTDILAYSRFINASENNVESYLIITEYEDPGVQTRVKQAKFAPVSMPAGESGAVSGYINGVTAAAGCTVMLWDTDFAPIIDSQSISAQN